MIASTLVTLALQALLASSEPQQAATPHAAVEQAAGHDAHAAPPADGHAAPVDAHAPAADAHAPAADAHGAPSGEHGDNRWYHYRGNLAGNCYLFNVS